MSKLYIHPYNDEGTLVQRGVITVSNQATRLQVAKRIYQCINREGVSNIRHIEVVNKAGLLFYAFDQRSESLVQTDGEGSDVYENSIFTFETLKQPQGSGVSKMNDQANAEVNQEAEDKTLAAAEAKAAREAAKLAKEQEREEAKAKREADKLAKEQEREEAKAKREADKLAKVEAKAAEKLAKEEERARKAKEREEAKANKEPTKKDRVLDLIRNGTTIDEIVQVIGVSDTAARSLIADVKRMGHSVVSTKNEETKISTFTLAA